MLWDLLGPPGWVVDAVLEVALDSFFPLINEIIILKIILHLLRLSNTFSQHCISEQVYFRLHRVTPTSGEQYPRSGCRASLSTLSSFPSSLTFFGDTVEFFCRRGQSHFVISTFSLFIVMERGSSFLAAAVFQALTGGFGESCWTWASEPEFCFGDLLWSPFWLFCSPSGWALEFSSVFEMLHCLRGICRRGGCSLSGDFTPTSSFLLMEPLERRFRFSALVVGFLLGGASSGSGST